MKRVRLLLFALGVIGAAVPGATAAKAAAFGPLRTGAAASTALGAATLDVEPAPGVTLSVDGLPYAGDVVVAAGSGGIDVVNRVGFERYVDGIGEMPSNWPAAALQAQAVAARTYALWSVLTHPSTPGGGQICATDDCQVYVGLSKTEGQDGADWAAAVAATAGDVLQYQGEVIEALYDASDGGQTLYGGVPWLPSVSDPQDALAPEHSWSWSAPLSAFSGPLEVPNGQTLVGLVSSTTEITETLQGAGGARTSVAVPPDTFHALVNAGLPVPAGMDLPLPSYRYSVSTYGNRVDIAGWGDGDGLGLSQYGALGKALQGWSAGQILGDYYAGTTVAPLPAGEMPATIGVVLQSGVASADIAANGPVTIADQSGRVLTATAGPAGWVAAPSAGSVTLDPSPAVAFPTGAGLASDVGPVPLRVAPPAGPGTAVTAGAGDAPATPTPTPSGAGPATHPTPPDPGPPAPAGWSRTAAAAAVAVPPRQGSPTWAAAVAAGLLGGAVTILVKQRQLLVPTRRTTPGGGTTPRRVRR